MLIYRAKPEREQTESSSLATEIVLRCERKAGQFPPDSEG